MQGTQHRLFPMSLYPQQREAPNATTHLVVDEVGCVHGEVGGLRHLVPQERVPARLAPRHLPQVGTQPQLRHHQARDARHLRWCRHAH